MPNTFSLIQSYSVGSGGQAAIDFTDIPASYTDLCLQASLRENDNAYVAYVEFNGSSANRTQRRLEGNGASAGTSSGATLFVNATATTGTASTFSNVSIYIPNYLSSNNKCISVDGVSESAQTTTYTTLNAAMWSSSSAITSIKLVTGGGVLQQHSTAYLYGIIKS